MTTKPTISKAELREKVLGIMHLVGCQTYSIGCNQTKDNTDGLLEVERLENLTTDEILALIDDQQRQLLDRLETELPRKEKILKEERNDGYGVDTYYKNGWNNAINGIRAVIKDIREGL